MPNTLTKYGIFKAIKADIRPTTLTEAKKKRLRVEAKQLAKVLQVLHRRKYDNIH